MRFRVGARTDVGRVRSGNEDSFMVEDPLFAVADGMGGHQGGEVASKLALETLSGVGRGGDLADTVREANRAVYRKASEDPELAGMGTTLTAVLADEGRLRVAHIGDSRLYVFRDGELTRLTTDHTVVERLVEEGRLTPQEAEMHPQRSILTRALGVDAEVEPDDDHVEVRTGDRLVLCSDGLTGMIEEGRISSILGAHEDPQAAADELVEAANEAGGQDNITVVVIDVVDAAGTSTATAPTVSDAAPTPEESTGPVAMPPEHPAVSPRRPASEAFAAGPTRRWGRRLLLWVLLPLFVIAAGLWAVKVFWVDEQFYVGEANGHVAVFRGIPAEPFGVDLSTTIEEYPDLDAATVTAFPEYATLPEGITAESEEEARAIVDDIRAAVSPPPAPDPDGGGGGGGGGGG